MSETDSITIIGRGAHIKGEITFDTPARILGTIEGTVHAKTEMYIGETALCKATVHGTSLLVDGTVEGALIASDRVELTPRCCVKGDITAGALIVADGASFIGHCCVGPEAVAQQRAKQQAHVQQTSIPTARVETPAKPEFRVEPRPEVRTEQAPPALQLNHETARAAEKPTARPSVIPDRIVIPDKPGVEIKSTNGATQPRPRARTADWMPPATPAFPTVVTKTTDWNGTAANA